MIAGFFAAFDLRHLTLRMICFPNLSTVSQEFIKPKFIHVATLDPTQISKTRGGQT